MATLEYDFRVIGTDAVRRAFATLEQRARQHNRNMSAIFGTPKGGVAGATGSASRLSFLQRKKEISQLESAEINSINRLTSARINADRRVAASRAQLRRQEEAQDVARERRAGLRNRLTNAGVGAVVGAGRVAAGAAKLAGMGLAAGMYMEGKTASRIATKLVAQSRMAGNKASFAEILKGAHGAASNAALAVGGDRSDIFAAMAAFHSKTGSIASAQNLSLFMARAAEATGSSYEDLGTVAGQVYANMMDQQPDTAENRKRAEEAARGFISTAAALGAEKMIELPQLAKYGARISGAANMMGGGPEGYAKNLALGLAIAEAAPSGTSTTAAESTLAVTRLIQDLANKAPEIEKDFGIKVRSIENGVPKLLPIEDTLPQFIAAMHADPVAAKKYGFGERGIRGFAGLTSLYQRGVRFGDKSLSEQQRGALSIREYMVAATKKTVSEKDLADLVRDRNELDPFQKLQTAINTLINKGMEPFGRAMGNLADFLSENESVITDLVTGFADLAKTLLKHPWESALAGIGLMIAKDIAAVGIGQTIATALTTSLAASSAGAAGLSVSSMTISSAGSLSLLGPIALAAGAATALFVALGGREQGLGFNPLLTPPEDLSDPNRASPARRQYEKDQLRKKLGLGPNDFVPVKGDVDLADAYGRVTGKNIQADILRQTDAYQMLVNSGGRTDKVQGQMRDPVSGRMLTPLQLTGPQSEQVQAGLAERAAAAKSLDKFAAAADAAAIRLENFAKDGAVNRSDSPAQPKVSSGGRK